jgi:hypothetical protein
MRMQSHTALCSFIFSMILTSAFVPTSGDAALAAAGAPAVQAAVQSALNGLRAQGFAGSAGIALPPAPAETPTAAPPASLPAASGPVFNAEVMNKVLQLISSKGKDGTVSPAIASTLGLTSGETWLDHKVAVIAPDKMNHGFAISRGADQDVVLYVRYPDTVHIFRAHRDGTLVAALTYNNQTQAIVVLPIAEAQAEHASELAIWAGSIDKLLTDA